jgi:LmbE family N-acetylglucosaminyl deacetylase
MKYRRVLALSPHTDDSELGCGGTLARLVDEGADVFVAAFSIAADSLPEGAPRDTLDLEFRQAVPILGVPPANLIVCDFPVRKFPFHRQEILEELVRLGRQVDPDLVLLPSRADLHQDHQVIHAEGLRAFKHLTILGYELPWNHIQFPAHAFVTLQPHHLELKWRALQAYKSQLQLGRVYFQPEFINGLARVRGTQVKADWAEAFEVVRIKW